MPRGRRPSLTRACAHCGKPFTVNPRCGRRHRFCSAPECVRQSHLRAQRKWRRSAKGRDYFQGKVNVYHVRAWREKNPGYWRRGRRQKRARGRSALGSLLRELALKDSMDTWFALVVGLVADQSNLALQDTIAAELRRLMLRGKALLETDSPRTLRP